MSSYLLFVIYIREMCTTLCVVLLSWSSSSVDVIAKCRASDAIAKCRARDAVAKCRTRDVRSLLRTWHQSAGPSSFATHSENTRQLLL